MKKENERNFFYLTKNSILITTKKVYNEFLLCKIIDLTLKKKIITYKKYLLILNKNSFYLLNLLLKNLE